MYNDIAFLPLFYFSWSYMIWFLPLLRWFTNKAKAFLVETHKAPKTMDPQPKMESEDKDPPRMGRSW